jgi:hypothetical protein
MTDHETEATEAVAPDEASGTVGITPDVAAINERMGSPISSSGFATEPEPEVKAKPKSAKKA